MTSDQKNEIAKLRNIGLGYKVIAKKMNIPVSTIKTHCQKYNLRPEDIEVDPGRCLICGKPLVQLPHTKNLCSNKCRVAYWRLTNTSRICIVCGRAFAPAQKNSKYCSHECYIKARFHGGADAV